MILFIIHLDLLVPVNHLVVQVVQVDHQVQVVQVVQVDHQVHFHLVQAVQAAHFHLVQVDLVQAVQAVQAPVDQAHHQVVLVDQALVDHHPVHQQLVLF